MILWPARSQLMAVAVAESKSLCEERPSTSLWGAMRLVRASVWDFSRMGSCKMMPETVGS